MPKESDKNGEPRTVDQQHYVRITKVLHHRFVEFEYSIGDPTLCVELVLPFPEFEQFCNRYQTERLTPEQVAAVDYDRLKWRFGAPGIAT